MTAPVAGSLVLHYRILGRLGSGGMGVVYEAEDTKLGRRVALKFLPPALAQDRPALERFQREARAASALNHPHICTIYAIEEADGHPFIAMERLEGESLDRRLAGRPLPWETVVELGVQIADALCAAHERGIIHRDIKPANIFVTRDGRAKVLDFGVAKIATRSEADTAGPSAAGNLTGPGLAVGTIAYMSPEQARGDELDARSDLFSLAAVLYEMATGQAAFEGRTSAVIFQKILGADPDAPRSRNAALPPRLEEVIVRGLEKDRDLRYQTAADLRSDLRRLRRDAGSGRLQVGPAATGTVTAAPRSSGEILIAEARRRRGLMSALSLGLISLVVAASYGIYALLAGDVPTAPVAAPGSRLTVTPLTTSGDVRGCGSISPDGKYVVYCDSANRLKVFQVATGSTVQIGTEAGDTTFSPDGNFVYLSSSNDKNPTGAAWAIPVLGGEPRRVATNLGGPIGVSPDGTRIAFARYNPTTREVAIMVASAEGGQERQVAIGALDDTSFADLGVAWSPDGQYLVAIQTTVTGGYRLRPVVIDVNTGATSVVGTRTWTGMGRPAWLPGNRVLFTAPERTLGPYQVWIAQHPVGDPVRLTSDVRGFGNYSVGVTADGSTIATVATTLVSNLWSLGPDGTGPLEQLTTGVQVDGNGGLAPQADGRVFYTSESGPDLVVWRLDGPGRPPRKLTRQYAEVPSTPADGRFVAFQAMDGDRFRIWRMEPDGSGARVISGGQDDITPTVSPDGRWVYYLPADGAARIVRIPSDGGAVQPITQRAVDLLDISTDGRRLLVRSHDESRSYALLDADTGAVQAQFSLQDANRAKFGRRPDVVAYIGDRDGVGNIWEQPIDGGPARPLTTFTSGRVFNFRYDPDRKRLFLARGTRTGDVVLIRDFQ